MQDQTPCLYNNIFNPDTSYTRLLPFLRMREATLAVDAQALTMTGTQLMPMSESATVNVRCIREAEGRALTLDDGAAVDGVGVAGHAAEHGNGRAARADGDVQAAEHRGEEASERGLGRRVEVLGVLDVLAALLGAGGGDGANEGERGDECLGEHGCGEGRGGRGS
jgi:hypothetical protein